MSSNTPNQDGNLLYLVEKYGSKRYFDRPEMPLTSYFSDIQPVKFEPWYYHRSKSWYWDATDTNCLRYMSDRVCEHYIAYLYGSRNPKTSWPKADPNNFPQVRFNFYVNI